MGGRGVTSAELPDPYKMGGCDPPPFLNNPFHNGIILPHFIRLFRTGMSSFRFPIGIRPQHRNFQRETVKGNLAFYEQLAEGTRTLVVPQACMRVLSTSSGTLISILFIAKSRLAKDCYSGEGRRTQTAAEAQSRHHPRPRHISDFSCFLTPGCQPLNLSQSVEFVWKALSPLLPELPPRVLLGSCRNHIHGP